MKLIRYNQNVLVGYVHFSIGLPMRMTVPSSLSLCRCVACVTNVVRVFSSQFSLFHSWHMHVHGKCHGKWLEATIGSMAIYTHMNEKCIWSMNDRSQLAWGAEAHENERFKYSAREYYWRHMAHARICIHSTEWLNIFVVVLPAIVLLGMHILLHGAYTSSGTENMRTRPLSKSINTLHNADNGINQIHQNGIIVSCPLHGNRQPFLCAHSTRAALKRQYTQPYFLSDNCEILVR